MTNTDHIAWCRQLMKSLHDGGVWGIPRSGMVFEKHPNELRLKELMPQEAIPSPHRNRISAKDLLTLQRLEFENVQDHFADAKVKVTDPKNLLGNRSQQ